MAGVVAKRLFGCWGRASVALKKVDFPFIGVPLCLEAFGQWL